MDILSDCQFESNMQRCIGNTSEVLGMYETKEKMLAAKEHFALHYAGQPGVVTGISGNLDEKGRRKPGEMYWIH